MKLESDATLDAPELVDANLSREEFKASLAQFAFSSESPSGSSPRRSPRKTVARKSWDDRSGMSANVVKQEAQIAPVKKRPRPLDDASEHELNLFSEEDKKLILPSPQKKKRGYAPPENYAHLHLLPDHLLPNLDVMFCGINPGEKSAEIGHHFGHPSNHFWRILHLSDFTTTRIPPVEDFSLPERFCLGFKTNLVDRPTADESELSMEEKRASVPGFLAKVARYRPRTVCFVGIGIANIVEQGVRSLNPSAWRVENQRAAPGSPSKSKSKVNHGLRPFKIRYAEADAKGITETLFYAAPSSSGRVTQYQLPDKVDVFKEMRACLESIKGAQLDTTYMNSIEALEAKE